MGSEGRRYRAAVAALEALYATLPTIACRGLCASCCGPIPLTDLEARRVQGATHTKPRTVVLPAPVVDATGNRRHERCIYLTAADRCGAYAVRPLMCRAFGVIKTLSCFHGCVPDRWMTDREFVALGQAIERVGGGRLLVTTPSGVALHPGTSFLDIDTAHGRPEAEVLADAERTRGLRALHGGRIFAVVTRGIDEG